MLRFPLCRIRGEWDTASNTRKGTDMVNRVSRLLLLSGLLTFAALSAQAEDWPQFRGPRRSGLSSETAWTHRWPEKGPKTLWTLDPGQSYACTLVAEGRAYITGSTKEKDTVYCLDAETGKEVWQFSFDHGKRAYMPDSYSNALLA